MTPYASDRKFATFKLEHAFTGEVLDTYDERSKANRAKAEQEKTGNWAYRVRGDEKI